MLLTSHAIEVEEKATGKSNENEINCLDLDRIKEWTIPIKVNGEESVMFCDTGSEASFILRVPGKESFETQDDTSVHLQLAD